MTASYLPAAQKVVPVAAANRLHRSRTSAAIGCAAVASLLDITLVTPDRTGILPRLLVSALSLAGLTIAGWAWLSLTTATRSAWAGYAAVHADSALARGWQRVLEVPDLPLAGLRITARGFRALFWLGYVPALEVSYRETAARYGPEAALHCLHARMAAFTSRAISWAVTIFWLAYVNIYFALGTWPGLATFLVVLIGAESAAVAWAVAARSAAARQFRCMTQVTGVGGLTELSHPWRPTQYATWCRAHGLEPYPFGRPDLTDGDRAVA